MLRAALRTALAATMVLTACGDDSEDQPGASLFTGDVSGAYATELGGRAVFGVTLDNAANGSGFSLVLGENDPVRIALFAYTTPKPRAGTYAIVGPGVSAGSDTVFSGFLTYTVGATIDTFQVTGGSITLLRANHNRAVGSFDLSAVRTTPADSAVVSISGSFDAGQIPQEFPLPTP